MGDKAQGAYGQLIAKVESAWGTFPETSNWEKIQFVSESMQGAKDFIESRTIRGDRQVQFVGYGNVKAAGAINAELVYRMFDTIVLPSAFYNVWGDGIGPVLKTVGTGLNDLSVDYSSAYTGTGNTAFAVKIATEGTPDTFQYSNDGGSTWETAASCATDWTTLESGVKIKFGSTTGHTADDRWDFKAFDGNMLVNQKTRKSFGLEKGFTDIGAYLRYPGCVVGNMSMSVAPNSIVTVGFDINAKDETSETSTIDAASADPSGLGGESFDSFSGVLYEGGVNVALLTQLNWSLNNNVKDGSVIGSRAKADVFAGRAMVSGNINCYVEDLTMYNKFVNGTESSIYFTLVDSDENTYHVWFPRVKYSGESPQIPGEDPVIQNMPFKALYDPLKGFAVSLMREDAAS